MIRYAKLRKKLKFKRQKPANLEYEQKIVDIIREKDGLLGSNWDEHMRLSSGKKMKTVPRGQVRERVVSLLSDDEEESEDEDEDGGQNLKPAATVTTNNATINQNQGQSGEASAGGAPGLFDHSGSSADEGENENEEEESGDENEESEEEVVEQPTSV